VTSHESVKRIPITCGLRGQTMVGTMHVSAADRATRGRIALVLLNAGPAPRAGNSDLSVHLADRLAKHGLPGFRFDFPGLGDSTGTSWRDIEAFWRASQRGLNDEAVVAIVNDLCARYELHGVLLGGLCAGAIAGVRTAESLGKRLLGLVLLEPNFRAAADVSSTQRQAEADDANAIVPMPTRFQRIRKAISRLGNFDELLYALTGSSKCARVFRPFRPILVRIVERRLGRQLPDDVLMDAVSTWRRLVDHGVPSLVMLAKGLGTDRHMERIMRTFSGVHVGVVDTVLIPDSNHILTAGDARVRAGDALSAWVAGRFPGAMSPPTPIGTDGSGATA
jgi:pimeloyl-ACP methyl ester carboxylesterase